MIISWVYSHDIGIWSSHWWIPMNLILVWDQWGIHPWESQGEYHHGYLGCFYWDIMGVSHENIMRIFSGNMMGRKKSSVSNFLIERCQLTHPILYTSEARGVGISTPIWKANIFLNSHTSPGSPQNSHTNRKFSHLLFSFLCLRRFILFLYFVILSMVLMGLLINHINWIKHATKLVAMEAVVIVISQNN